MKTVTLGTTGLEVTPIGYGTWQFGRDLGPVDERAALHAIGHARSLGISFFDTAQACGFGRSEWLLGRALAADLRWDRDSVVIATTGGLRMDGDRVVRDASPAWLRKGLEARLDALRTQYVDLYQVHHDPSTPVGETAAALADLVREGLIRHVGVANYTVGQIAEFAAVLPVETIRPAYHVFRRDIEARLLSYAAAHGIGVLAYGPLAHGPLGLGHSPAEVAALRRFAADRGASVAQLAVTWLLAHPAVQVAIVGSQTPAHLHGSLGALDLTLSQDDLAEIDTIMASTARPPRPRASAFAG